MSQRLAPEEQTPLSAILVWNAQLAIKTSSQAAKERRLGGPRRERLEVETNGPPGVNGEPCTRRHDFADPRIDTHLPLQHADVVNGKVTYRAASRQPSNENDWKSGPLR